MPLLTPGDPFPFFKGRTPQRPDFVIDSMAGRYIVLSYFVSAGLPFGRRFLDHITAMAARFDDRRCSFFGVSIDQTDETAGRLEESPPGVRFFFDSDLRISRLGGVTPPGLPEGGGSPPYTPVTYVLDPSFRVLAIAPFRESDEHAAWLSAVLDTLPALPPPYAAPAHAPVLVVPRIFDPGLCTRLVAAYEADGGGESGYMVEKDGRTVPVINGAKKRRRDAGIEDPELRAAILDAVRRRLLPLMERAFQARLTRIERYIVASYEGRNRGHFHAHRDNTTRGTAHRQFAVSIGLDENYHGGEMCFPEYGGALYRPSVGGALVFSCSILHEVRPVTAGRRMVFLTFLYDDQQASVRRTNSRFLGAESPAPAPDQPAQNPAEPVAGTAPPTGAVLDAHTVPALAEPANA